MAKKASAKALPAEDKKKASDIKKTKSKTTAAKRTANVKSAAGKVSVKKTVSRNSPKLAKERYSTTASGKTLVIVESPA
ncbi:MAG: hypothetical protein LBK91_03620, partial [Synergistaceae bacterium]|nr:hypothetical protein [Synergistaceae bacterium]